MNGTLGRMCHKIAFVFTRFGRQGSDVNLPQDWLAGEIIANVAEVPNASVIPQTDLP